MIIRRRRERLGRLLAKAGYEIVSLDALSRAAGHEYPYFVWDPYLCVESKYIQCLTYGKEFPDYEQKMEEFKERCGSGYWAIFIAPLDFGYLCVEFHDIKSIEQYALRVRAFSTLSGLIRTNLDGIIVSGAVNWSSGVNTWPAVEGYATYRMVPSVWALARYINRYRDR